MTKAKLTPKADQTPAVAKVAKELSGVAWVSRFPGSKSTDTLTPEFKTAVDLFKSAIEAGGGSVRINNTFRPTQRAYMMHWSYQIETLKISPDKVPAMDGVTIEWVHATDEESIHAARLMLEGFAMKNLKTSPALDSLHALGQAIDMDISWEGDLVILKQDDTSVTIQTKPRTGMNAKLTEVGKSYGVIKFVGGASDRPHWSTTGH